MSPPYDLGIAAFYFGVFKGPDGQPPVGGALKRRVEAFAVGMAGWKACPLECLLYMRLPHPDHP